MRQLVSVIVPVYHVEAYLEKCIKSILNQSYRELDIILVDDGGMDSCGKICDVFAENDSRITVIHKKNGGLSAARNDGIEIARGDYISFVDSDDFIHEEMIERLMALITTNNSDIAICDYQFIYSGEKHKTNSELGVDQEASSFSGKVLLERGYNDYILQNKLVVTWNKLYKRELFDQLRFPIGKIHEDDFTSYKLIYKAKSVALSEHKMYFYLQRDDSIMGKMKTYEQKKDQLIYLDVYEEIVGFYSEHQELRLVSLALNNYLFWLRKYDAFLVNAGAEKQERQEIRQRYRQGIHGFMRKTEFRLTKKIQCQLFNINPRLNVIAESIIARRKSNCE